MTVTDIGHDLSRMGTQLRARVDRAGRALSRATPGPALVRGGVFLAGVVALATAWPADFVLSRGLALVLLLPLLPALLPRGFLPTLVIMAGALGWLAATTVYAEPLTLARLVIVADALYLLHTLAALAAVLPYDAIISAGVLGRWLMRAALVVVLTAGLALVLVVVAGQLGGARYLAASLVGLSVVIGLALYLASLARRR